MCQESLRNEEIKTFDVLDNPFIIALKQKQAM